MDIEKMSDQYRKLNLKLISPFKSSTKSLILSQQFYNLLYTNKPVIKIILQLIRYYIYIQTMLKILH